MLIKPDNDGIHIEHIVNSTKCAKHGAEEGTPCWDIFIGAIQEEGMAVCGTRIRSAGFEGRISRSSLSLGSAKPVKKPFLKSN